MTKVGDEYRDGDRKVTVLFLAEPDEGPIDVGRYAPAAGRFYAVVEVNQMGGKGYFDDGVLDLHPTLSHAMLDIDDRLNDHLAEWGEMIRPQVESAREDLWRRHSHGHKCTLREIPNEFEENGKTSSCDYHITIIEIGDVD